MNENEIQYLANYIIDNKSTIRKTAKIFNIPKSTLHYNVTKKLINLNYVLYSKLHKFLQSNFNEKHIRGGMATKNKYKKLKKDITIKNNSL